MNFAGFMSELSVNTVKKVSVVVQRKLKQQICTVCVMLFLSEISTLGTGTLWYGVYMDGRAHTANL
jgi:hypothetical protein